jgi:glyoxylase-like metal-dependent hydrolase (beta-lactamase superfamily II)
MSERELGFVEIADRVYLLRYPVLDVNVTLIVGDGGAVLIDTLSTPKQAAELHTAARRVTSMPWAIVNTHHHFDHTFGNATLAGSPPCPVWAHEAAATALADPDAARRAAVAAASAHDRRLASALAGVDILAPTRTVQRAVTLDVGGRVVALHHLGRGHTAGDLVVHLPDADLVVAGDLVEESGPPAFEDAYPLEWPETVAALLRLTTPDSVVVPGHGLPVGRGFVTGQHQELAALEWLIREAHADGAPVEKAAARAPFGGKTAATAVRRGYAELNGSLD